MTTYAGSQPASATLAAESPPLSTVLVVVNGGSTHAVGRNAVDAIRRALQTTGAGVEVVETSTVDDFASAWHTYRPQRIVLVGGDGTVHAAANVVGSAAELALVPTGSANNVARSLGIPLDLAAAAELAALGTAHPLDLIEASSAEGSRLVVEGVSVGFLARARSLYDAPNSGHALAAVAAGARALMSFHPLAVHVRLQPREEDLVLAQLFVANLPLYAFGLQVAPHADPSDAMLDLVGFEADGRRSVMAMLHALRRGRHIGRPGVHLWRVRRASIATHGSSPIIGDSTDLGEGPIALRAAPAALRLVRPR